MGHPVYLLLGQKGRCSMTFKRTHLIPLIRHSEEGRSHMAEVVTDRVKDKCLFDVANSFCIVVHFLFLDMINVITSVIVDVVFLTNINHF